MERGKDRFGRFILLELLGQGAFAKVYRAYNTLKMQEVALKLLKPGLFDEASARLGLENEAAAFIQFSHRSIVRLHEVVRVKGQLALAMELVDGGTLARRIKQGPIPYPQVITLGLTAASALQYVHEHHRVHRDVKPFNLLLTRSGELKVADFGLVRFLPQPSDFPAEAGDRIVGTLFYMAPEQIQALPAGPQSDVFALSVVLFECLAGRRPFEGKDFWSIREAIEKQEPPWQTLVELGVPEPLRAVLARGLEKDPARRYLTMSALASDLELVLAGRRPAGRRAKPLLTGRRAELQRLQLELESSSRPGGTGRAVFVSGEAGIGKTQLVSEFGRMAAADARARVSVAEFRQGRDGLRALLGAIRRLTSASAPGPDRGYEDPAAEVTDLPLLVEETLRRLARSPFVLVLEDLHNAGPDALRAVRTVVSSIHSYPGLVIATYRPETALPGGDAEPHGLLPGMLADRHTIQIPLDRFNLEETTALTGDVLGGPVDEEFAQRLQEDSEGIPFFLRQILEFLRAQGVTGKTGAQAMEEPIVTRAIQDILVHRLEALPEELRRVMDLAAVQGEVFRLHTLAYLLDAPLEEVFAAIDRLVGGHLLVVPDGDRYRFAHAKFREQLLRDMPPERRGSLHLRLAEWLRKTRPEAVADIARHYAEAGRYDEAAPWLRKAAQRALDEAAVEEARELFTAAVDACRKTGRTDTLEHAENLETLGRLERQRGRVDAARSLLASVVRDCRAHPRPWARALHHLGWTVLDGGEPTQAAQLFRRAQRQFEVLGDGVWAAACDDSLGAALRCAGDLGGALRAARRALERRKRLRFAWGVHLSRSNLGAIDILRGRFPEAYREFHKCTEYFRRQRQTADVRQKLATALSNLASTCEGLGQLDRAIEAHAEALALHRQTGNRLGQAITLAGLGDVHAKVGRTDAAVDEYTRAEVLARDRGHRVRSYALCGLARVRHASGALAEASSAATGALAAGREAQDPDCETSALLQVARIQLDMGVYDEARKAQAAAAKIARKHRLGGHLTEVEHVRALVEEARGNRSAARAAFEKAIAAAGRGAPELKWRVLRDYAAVLEADPRTSPWGRRVRSRARSSLRELASRIGDPMLRQAYRSDPERSALLALRAPAIRASADDVPPDEAPTAPGSYDPDGPGPPTLDGRV